MNSAALAIDILGAVKEWRDARSSFFKMQDVSMDELHSKTEIWMRLGRAEDHLMELARDIKG